MGARQHPVARATDEHLAQQPLTREVDPRRAAAEVPVLGPGPLAAAELLAGASEQQQRLAGLLETHRRTPGDVVEQTEDADDRGRVDRRTGGGVVETDVAAGHRDAEGGAAVGEPAGRLGELPHHLRVLGAAEVQAVGDGDRHRARRGDVAVGLGERELRAGVRIEPGVAPVAVGGEGDPEPGLLRQPHHAGVLRPGEHRVAEHDPVVLLDDPALGAEVRAADHPQQQLWRDLGEGRERLGLQLVEVGRPGGRPLVDRAVVGEAARRHVDDSLAVPLHAEPVAGRDLADGGGKHPPLLRDREDLVEVAWLDDRQHPLLGLTRQYLVRLHARLAERHPVQVREHPGPPGGGGLGQGAGQPRPAEVLDARDQVGVEHLQAALDQQLLGERVADLHRGPLGRATLVEGRAGQHADAADPVAAGPRAEQHHDVAGAAGGAALDAVLAQHAEAQRVDQRVALVAGVEHDLAADVGQAEAVPVSADARDDPGQHPGGVGVLRVAEPERIHDEHRSGAHRQDVADNAADAGRRPLVGLDVARMIVRLDLEGDRETFTDIHDPGVLAHPHEQPVPRRLRNVADDVPELPQVHLAALVRAVLTPHDRVHRQLGLRRAASQHLADPGVLIGLQSQVGVRLELVRGAPRDLDGVHDRFARGRPVDGGRGGAGRVGGRLTHGTEG